MSAYIYTSDLHRDKSEQKILSCNKNKTLGNPFKSDLHACVITNPSPNLSYPMLKVALITRRAHRKVQPRSYCIPYGVPSPRFLLMDEGEKAAVVIAQGFRRNLVDLVVSVWFFFGMVCLFYFSQAKHFSGVIDEVTILQLRM